MYVSTYGFGWVGYSEIQGVWLKKGTRKEKKEGRQNEELSNIPELDLHAVLDTFLDCEWVLASLLSSGYRKLYYNELSCINIQVVAYLPWRGRQRRRDGLPLQGQCSQ